MQTVKIFLASSAELHEDRRDFELLLGRKNKEWVPRGVFLELVIWEDFLDALAPTRLQDEYNAVIRACDLFVMLFHTKVGKYTEEEFEAAVGQFQATRRPFIFTYYKAAAAAAGSTVSAADTASLVAFQSKLKAMGHYQTIYKSVAELNLHFYRQLEKLAVAKFVRLEADGDAEGFTAAAAAARQMFTANLAPGAVLVVGSSYAPIKTTTQIDTRGGHVIGRDFIQHIMQVAQPGEDPAELQSVVASYLDSLANDLAGIKLGDIDDAPDQSRQTPLQLADIYVPLNTNLRLPKGMALQQWLAHKRAPQGGKHEAEAENEPVSALQALATHRQLTLLGLPGSGKSTFGAHVLLAMAQAWQGQPGALQALGEAWEHGAKLPIRVVLRQFSESLPAGDKPATAGDLWAFIAQDLQASGYGLSDRTAEYLKRLARNQGALFLLDGLDECGDEARRKRVQAALNALVRSAGPQCRFLLTARPYAWPKGADPAEGVYALAELEDEQIEQFIQRWYAALEQRKWRSPADAAKKRDDLLGAYQRPELLPLARNPLLLTLMTTLHSNRGHLPEDRADLYNASVDLLLLRWTRTSGSEQALLDALNQKDLKLSNLRSVLERVALEAHESNLGEGTANIGEDTLVRAFTPLLGGSKDKADLVVDYIEKRAGLLLGLGQRKGGEREFSFPHRSFQEFLAACHLQAKGDFPAQCARLARLAPTHWHVVLPLAARLAGAERGASAADHLVGGQGVEEFKRQVEPGAAEWLFALLAAMQLAELGTGALQAEKRTANIAARVANWLVAAMPLHPSSGGLRAVQRAMAGDVLAALGDPRFDANHAHLPAEPGHGFVRIEADAEFRIGTASTQRDRISQIVKEDVPGDEINDAATPTQAFYMGRYPVTVAQFKAYLQATQTEPGYGDALRDPPNRPVRYVSWSEALEYCEWLNVQLQHAPEFADSDLAALVRSGGWQVGLPTEREWEKAARGGLVGQVFSWGDEPDIERANHNDSGVNDSSAVGCFEANGYGLHDMLGNLWEWTSSPGMSRVADEDGAVISLGRLENVITLVVRGGSWFLPAGYARCAFRDHLHPGGRLHFLGLRVMLRSSPVSKR